MISRKRKRTSPSATTEPSSTLSSSSGTGLKSALPKSSKKRKNPVRVQVVPKRLRIKRQRLSDEPHDSKSPRAAPKTIDFPFQDGWVMHQRRCGLLDTGLMPNVTFTDLEPDDITTRPFETYDADWEDKMRYQGVAMYKFSGSRVELHGEWVPVRPLGIGKGSLVALYKRLDKSIGPMV